MADGDSQQRKPNVRTAVEDVKAAAIVFAKEAEGVLGRRTARVLGVLVLFAVVVGVLLALLDWYIAPTDVEQKQSLVVTLAQILGGAALLLGLYFTWRTLQVNREGQITERFTRAIDQLGSERLEIRLGGIYALERIARDSDRDHWPIMEVLTAYVRVHAPRPPEQNQQGGGESAAAENPEEDSGGSREDTALTRASIPAADIQAILTVLRRRTRSYGQGEPEPLNLLETNISYAHLWAADLRGARLLRADLGGANLLEADLRESYCILANLRGAHLIEADLRRAHLMGADLRGADLRATDLSEANLMGADIRGANLLGADLRGAALSGADLREARLVQEQLEEATGDGSTKLPSYLKPPRTGA